MRALTLRFSASFHEKVKHGFVCSVAAICASWLVIGTAGATQDVQLTTVRGKASIADQALTQRSGLAEDADLETGDDGNASVLLDRNAVVELCGRSRVQFTRDAKSKTRIVNIKSGEVKLIVEPREPGERIEIHTPAAIATILGTVVYVSVDPVTGATTISSSQSQVNIRSRDDASGAGTTISAYEQLTTVPGESAQQKKDVSAEQITALTSCLLDFHDMAVKVDRVPVETSAATRVAAADMGDSGLPGVAMNADAGTVGDMGTPGQDLDVEVEVTDLHDTMQDEMMVAVPADPKGIDRGFPPREDQR